MLLILISNWSNLKDGFKKPTYLNIDKIIKANKIKLQKNEKYFCKIITQNNSKILTRLKFGLNIGGNNLGAIPSNICFNAHVPNEKILHKPSTFKWGLLQNLNNSVVIISNMSFLRKKFRDANIIIKFWNSNNSAHLSKKIKINDNGSYWFYLSKEKKIKEFLKKKPGWVTIQSDNPFVTGWYLELSKNNSVGADHLF